MKVFGLLLGILAIISSVMALKNDFCRLGISTDGWPTKGYSQCKPFMRYWGYKQDTNECIPFTLGGCGGNINRFYFKEECEKYCKE